MPVVRISGSELAADFRSGMTDGQLMEKYGLTREGLNSLYLKAMQSGVVGLHELCGRYGISDFQIHVENARKFRRYPLQFPLEVRDSDRPDNQGTVIDISSQGVMTKGLRASAGETMRMEIPIDWYGLGYTLLLEVKCQWYQAEDGRVAGFQILDVLRGEFPCILEDLSPDSELIADSADVVLTQRPGMTDDQAPAVPAVPTRDGMGAAGSRGRAASRIWFFDFLNLVPIPSFLIDERWTIAFVSRAALFIGSGVFSLRGKPFGSLFPDNSAARLARSLARRTLVTGVPAKSEGVLVCQRKKIRSHFQLYPVGIRGHQSILMLVFPGESEVSESAPGDPLRGPRHAREVMGAYRTSQRSAGQSSQRHSVWAAIHAEWFGSSNPVLGQVFDTFEKRAALSTAPAVTQPGGPSTAFRSMLGRQAAFPKGKVQSLTHLARISRSLLTQVHGNDSPNGGRLVHAESQFKSGRLKADQASDGQPDVAEIVRSAAQSEGTVLLYGESGAGKDYWAQFIHHQSRRAKGPFISINCAAVPQELAESEFFGHEAGSFTGAGSLKRGLVESAHGGTLLLNEVGELSLLLQAKLLTFMDNMQFRRVGGHTALTVDTRILVATNKDLAEEVKKGGFRQDLFYRLNVLPIRIPPLRERVASLPVLINELLASLGRKMGLSAIPSVDSSTLAALQAYPWPGNVRELRNKLERSLILSAGRVVDLALMFEQVPEPEWNLNLQFSQTTNLYDISSEVKRRIVVEALRRAGGKRQRAAEILGITRYALKRQMATLGLAGGKRQ